MRPPRIDIRALGPAALIALAAAATWPITFCGLAIARGDLLLYFYPLRDFASQAVREGRLPLWNPYTFMGAPFLANSQVGFFYPINLLLAWLPADRAVSWQIGLHLAIAALGAYGLARRGFGLRRLGAFAAALVFGLGGYLGAQVEHINQLQALAWLPLMVMCGLRLVDGPGQGQGILSRGMARAALALAGLVALQVFAGHTQSLYISLFGLGLACLLRSLSAPRAPLARRARTALVWLIALVSAGALGALLSAAQLAPSLELAGESARAGGLPFNEVGSFSWRPWVMARAMLPPFGDPLFPEYIAYLGASGLALALAGLILPGAAGSRGGRVVALGLALAGVILALGVATPLFNLLYRFLPGFNLFRAQARWLVLLALGAALLAGYGVDALRAAASARRWRMLFAAWIGLMLLLGAGLILGARLSPEAEYRGLPATSTLIGWMAFGGAVTLAMTVAAFWPRARSAASLALPALLVLELMLGARYQPYTRASDPGALTDLRPSTLHVLVDNATPGASGRILTLSGLFFDPGDMPEQRLIYGPGLSADGLYDRIIASKHKEILSPNLSLTYRLPSVDGYDGGLLPLKRYVDFVGQFAAREKGGALDGRLREVLTGVPANAWLEKLGVRYVIADKTADIFIDGVYYDLLFSALISPALSVALRPYDSTALGLVFGSRLGTSALAVTATLAFADGAVRVAPLTVLSPTFAARIDLSGRRIPLTLTLQSTSEAQLRALTSIDATDSSFLSQGVGGEHRMRVVHSGDVKIYENLNAAPRAFVQDAAGAPMAVVIAEEAAERLRIVIPPGASAGRLVLRDACYPGWVAWVDGVPVSIACFEGLFRAVELGPGAREVVFAYEPASVRIGLLLSGVGLVVWVALMAWFGRFAAKAAIQRIWKRFPPPTLP
ncbi:MAG: hypothetical protein ABIQ99_02345 [Thermoflexales bacterium]